MSSSIKYPINEIFATLQGEACFTGTPSIFIRMQGCDVGCGWCDTKHTWRLDQQTQSTFEDIANKTGDKNNWAFATIDTILDYIQKNFIQITHVVITGGEPAQYNLEPLCIALETLGKNIQIETSGTSKLQISAKTWVTLSPKIDMPNGKPIIDSAVARANELKMPVGKISDIEKLKWFIHSYNLPKNLPIWLQPLSQNQSATELCIAEALNNNWRLSIQTHKFLNIR